MLRNWKVFSEESGAVPIIEAVFVYPLVIFVVIILMLLGNLFYQQSRVESITARGAEKLAAYYANPTLAGGAIPTDCQSMNLEPYRYLTGGSVAEGLARTQINDELSQIGTGAFEGMKINYTIDECTVDNYVVSQTGTVKVSYSINFFPMKLIGATTRYTYGVNAKTSAADPAEFIRNVDMILDYNEKYHVTDGISEKMNSTVGKFTGH